MFSSFFDMILRIHFRIKKIKVISFHETIYFNKVTKAIERFQRNSNCAGD